MNGARFFIQYILRPRSIGAVLPSSRFLAREMVAGIDLTPEKCIVEFGAGTGVFTREIMKKRNPATPFLVFERNRQLYDYLVEEFRGEKNLHLICDSAEEMGKYLRRLKLPAPGVIFSGLPFASLPAQVSQDVLSVAQQHMRPGGAFITFQYTRLKLGLFSRYFPVIKFSRRVWLNVPPAYVLRCINQKP